MIEAIIDGTCMIPKQFLTHRRNGTNPFSLRKHIGVITRGQGKYTTQFKLNEVNTLFNAKEEFIDISNNECFINRIMNVYATSAEQPKLGRSVDELSEYEKPIYELFTQEQFVDKFIKFLTLEENKGKDKFHHKHFILFKVKIK